LIFNYQYSLGQEKQFGLPGNRGEIGAQGKRGEDAESIFWSPLETNLNFVTLILFAVYFIFRKLNQKKAGF